MRRWLAIAAAALAWGCGGGDGTPARPGEFDRFFGTDGIAILEGGPFQGASAAARFAAADPGSGTIRAGGHVRRSSVHARLTREGVPDTGFAGSGFLLLPPQPTDFPLDNSREGIAAFGRPDGSEMRVDRVFVPCVTGPSCAISGGGYDFTAVRVVTPSGEPVAGYGDERGEGVLALEPLQAIAEPSGALLVLGRAHAGVGGIRRNALGRLTPQGIPDEGFRGNALAALDCPGFDPLRSFGTALARRADGKLLVAQSYATDTTPANSRVCVSRLMPDGSIDAGFGDGGYVVLGWEFQWDVMTPVAIFPLPNGGSALFLQKRRELDGKSYYSYMIATLVASGALDASRFDRGITGPTDLHVAKLEAVTLQADGKYLVAGYPVPGYDQPGTGQPEPGYDTSLPRVGRLHPEGGADLSFGPLGRGYTPLIFSGKPLSPRHASIGPDGGILVAGALLASGANPVTQFAVAKLVGDSGPP